MKSKSFARSKSHRCATRQLAREIRDIKTRRVRSERRLAHQLLKCGEDEVAPIVKRSNHSGAAAWEIT
jgi:hypothetical protein